MFAGWKTKQFTAKNFCAIQLIMSYNWNFFDEWMNEGMNEQRDDARMDGWKNITMSNIN